MNPTGGKTDVAALLNSYREGRHNLITLVRQIPEPRDAPMQALLHMLESRIGRCSKDLALREARLVAPDQIADPNLALLFCREWISLCLSRQLLDEAEAVIHLAESRVGRKSPPEFQATAVLCRGLLEGAKGNKVARLKSFAEALSILPKDSLRRLGVMFSRAFFLAEQGRATEVASDVNLLASRRNGVIRPGHVAMVRFIDGVETGRLCDAQEVWPLVEADPELMELVAVDIAKGRVVLSLMLGEWTPGSAAAGQAHNSWAMATLELCRANPAKALDWARLHAAENSTAHLTVGFHSLTLVRAELAGGNPGAAMRVLGQRWAAGYRGYLDDFFVARAELAQGHRESAARYLWTALRAAERYRAAGRLEFEMRLACEFDPKKLLSLMPAAARRGTAKTDRAELGPGSPPKPHEPHGIERLQGVSATIEAVRGQIVRIAPLEVPVLITGETGTGKEIVARAIHEGSSRAVEPFVAINCGAISESLLESELFGHAKGAFTGAVAEHKGVFEEAGRGTLLLDEIGEISERLQVALLRVLENGEFRPVGSARPRKVSCRVLAATNADLGKCASGGRFRPDLLYRLRRMEVYIPPLRERREDILVLAEHFLREGQAQGIRPSLSNSLRAELQARDWPGNVRELRSAVERMRLLNSDKLVFDLQDLELPLGPPTSAPADSASESERTLPVVNHGNLGPFLHEGRSAMRRLDRLRDLFRQHGKLTRVEICAIMKVSRSTATCDLRQLCSEGSIEKVRPSASPRTHYFRLVFG